jgi:SAM-dependent methyltransferase
MAEDYTTTEGAYNVVQRHSWVPAKSLVTDSFPCHACGALVRAIPTRALQFMAGSDCTPVTGEVAIGSCSGCGLLQKHTGAAWQRLCDQIYANYQIYHQAAGIEQKARDPGNWQFAPRSELIARHLSRAASFPQNGSALDLGCGNGAFMRGMRKQFSGWRLVGSDLNENFREQILALGPQAAFKTEAELAQKSESFDVVSLIHCVEHIPNPSHYLDHARRYLKRTGVLLIEVPDAELNPFDLVVADHASHFSKRTLAHVVEAAGYEVLSCGNDVIGKEITLLARPLGIARRAKPADQTEPDLARRNLSWLEDAMDQAHTLAEKDEAFGVFGTSIAGVWIASTLARKIAFFVDEDEARIGRDYFGVPILAPSHVPAGATVFVCLEPRLAQAIAERHGKAGRRYIPTTAVA